MNIYQQLLPPPVRRGSNNRRKHGGGWLLMLTLLLMLTQHGFAQELGGVATYDAIECAGGTTTLTITGSGGAPPDSYSINGTTYQPGNTFTVGAGTYTQIKVKDANGIVANVPSVTIADGAANTTYYTDADFDGYGVTSSAFSTCIDPGFGYSTEGGDCNDGNDAIYPGATEVCNGFDDDCDGSSDEGLPTETFYVDSDTDGY